MTCIDSRSGARVEHPGSPEDRRVLDARVQPVLVVVDGPVAYQPSEAGTTALDLGFRAAVERSAPLWVVASMDTFEPYASRREKRDGRHLKELLDAIIAPWRACYPLVDVRRFVSSGDVAEVALAWAPLIQLIVIDEHAVPAGSKR